LSSSIQGMPRIDWGNIELEVRKPAENKSEFWNTLKESIHQVEQVQAEAESQVAGIVGGKGEDLHTAMIAVEKADLSFQLMMQVRNKIVQAYQEISQMQF